MKDKKALAVLQEFIDDHSLTIGSGLKITLGQFTTSIKPIESDNPMPGRYEDAVWISSILKGAESFMYWLQRNNYKIVRGK